MTLRFVISGLARDWVHGKINEEYLLSKYNAVVDYGILYIGDIENRNDYYETLEFLFFNLHRISAVIFATSLSSLNNFSRIYGATKGAEGICGKRAFARYIIERANFLPYVLRFADIREKLNNKQQRKNENQTKCVGDWTNCRNNSARDWLRDNSTCDNTAGKQLCSP